MCLDKHPAQLLGKNDLRAHPRRPEDAQEEGSHRPGTQDRGGVVGHAEERDGLGPRKGWDRSVIRSPINEHETGRCDRVTHLTRACRADRLRRARCREYECDQRHFETTAIT